MLKCKLMIRSALIALFVLTLVVAYPVVVNQGVVLAQGIDPADEEPEPEDPRLEADFIKLVNGQDANTLDAAVEVEAGANVTFRYEVNNTGNITLTWTTLTDDVLGDLTAECALPRTIIPNAVEACDITRPAGSHPDGLQNIGTATLTHNVVSLGQLPPQQDPGWYRTPAVDPEPMPGYNFTKLVNSQDANEFESSILVPIGSSVVYQFQVANTGNVPIEWTTLVDDIYGDLTAECELPATINVGLTATCEITRLAGEFPDGRRNIATATVNNLTPQQDVAWYRTPPQDPPVQPEPTPPTPMPTPTQPPVPIPEPITIVLFGTGLAALGAAAARRRNQD